MYNFNEKQRRLSNLAKIISDRKESLGKYVLNPNAKKYFVDKLNGEIDELTQIFNYLDNANNSEFWFEFGEKIVDLNKQDSEVSGIIILMSKHSGNGHYTKLSIDLPNGL